MQRQPGENLDHPDNGVAKVDTSSYEKRLEAIEERLGRLEERLARPMEAPTFTFEELPPSRLAFPRQRWISPAPRPFPVTELLGWGGVAALVLAAAYLIKLGIDLGWLTPARQVLLAALGGLLLTGTGVALRRADRQYASLLPAGGMAVLFLAAYGAHLYYRLIPFGAALGAVILICLVSLWLCRYFQSELYAFFAVAGSYSAPQLLDGLRTGVGELAIYYSAWGLLFCAFAVWISRRSIYLLAACLALLSFDVVWYAQWRSLPNPPWQAALIFQGVQGVIFAGTTALFTLLRKSPLDRNSAWGHLPPLLLFYLLQYALLNRYLHDLAPWIAIASAALIAGLYWLVRSKLGGSLPGGQVVVVVYAAVVLFHAGYLEALPDEWQPWAGLAAGGALAAWLLTQRLEPLANGTVLGVLGLMFIINLLRADLDFSLAQVPGSDWLALAYALELYVGFALARRVALQRFVRGALIYSGHISAMAAAVHLFDSRLMVSFCWAILAVTSLGLALSWRARLLAQSSLLVFACSGIKVLIYDLAGASPLVRIGSLVILGVSLYLGGWLYRKIPVDNEGQAIAAHSQTTS
jgi:uncharacterized membrane protein